MIRVDALWLSVVPLDMRAGTETILARVVQVFGAAMPHHGGLCHYWASFRACRCLPTLTDSTLTNCAAC